MPVRFDDIKTINQTTVSERFVAPAQSRAPAHLNLQSAIICQIENFYFRISDFSVLDLWTGQPEEQIPHGRSDRDAVRTVGDGNGIGAGRPFRGGQFVVLQQTVTADVWPGNLHGVRTDILDDQIRNSRRLHGDDTPEAASEGIIAARHWAAGVVLADGTANRIVAAHAGTATAGNIVPVNTKALGHSVHR